MPGTTKILRDEDLRLIEEMQSDVLIASALGRSKNREYKIKLAELDSYSEDKICARNFQEEAIKSALDKLRVDNLWNCEIAPGSGKTYISARVVVDGGFLDKGRIIYVCPSITAIGDQKNGIIRDFVRTFKFLNIPIDLLGFGNKLDRTKKVWFFTPQLLHGLKSQQSKLFDLIMEESSLLILDEVHHFPEEGSKEDLVIYGQISKFATDYFISKGKKVIAMTATHGRMDGKKVFGTPSFKYSVQSSVDDGYSPEIHGVEVLLDVNCPNAKKSGQFYDDGLTGQNRIDYLRRVSDIMLQVWKKRPKPTCAFVRKKEDVYYLTDIFNKSSNLGDKGLAVLLGDTTGDERQRIIQEINSGNRLGYITCNVGAESVNIPSLEVVHLIVRTRSIVKLMQSIGRGLRPYNNKKSLFIVDYWLKSKLIVAGALGLLDWAKYARVNLNISHRIGNGGPIIVSRLNGPLEPISDGVLALGDVKTLVSRSLDRTLSAWVDKLEEVQSLSPVDFSEG
jgi:superfamily II DNA or RNA helicase